MFAETVGRYRSVAWCGVSRRCALFRVALFRDRIASIRFVLRCAALCCGRHGLSSAIMYDIFCLLDGET